MARRLRLVPGWVVFGDVGLEPVVARLVVDVGLKCVFIFSGKTTLGNCVKKTTYLAIAVASICSSPAIADVKISERQASFGECRAMLQVLAGALSGKLAEYSRDTSTILESSFESTDGSTKYTITCLADEQKMVIREEPI